MTTMSKKYSREYMREYRKKHPDSGKIAAKRWRDRHPEKKRDSNKKFIASHPDYYRNRYDLLRAQSVVKHGHTKNIILSMYSEGKKIREIAELLGCSYENVRQHLRASGK